MLYKTYYLKKQSLNAESLKEKNTFLEDQLTNPDKDFIKNTIEGGVSFNSTEVFINNLKNEL